MPDRRARAGALLRGSIWRRDRNPEDDTEIVEPTPEVYEQWWFWTAIGGGVVAVTIGIIVGVVVGGEANQGPPDGLFRFELGRLP
ncbi:MAG: hypothetical protein R3B82_00560 [Sandaracinaceae bacterium]